MQLWLKQHEFTKSQNKPAHFPAAKEDQYEESSDGYQCSAYLSLRLHSNRRGTRLDIPISGHDRVYAANQTSNTVSVIDPPPISCWA